MNKIEKKSENKQKEKTVRLMKGNRFLVFVLTEDKIQDFIISWNKKSSITVAGKSGFNLDHFDNFEIV